jgi:hypothetical protein
MEAEDDRICLGPKEGRAVVLVRVQDVDQVVGNKLPFLSGRLGCADIHPAVNLHGIGAEDFTAEPLGQTKSQRGFPGGGGSDDGYKAGQGGHNKEIMAFSNSG